MFFNLVSPSTINKDLMSPSTCKSHYYDKGPTSEVRGILQRDQPIESVLSKEEIFKLQNSLLEAKPSQIQNLPYSYVNELMRLSEIIQKVLGQHDE